MVQLPQSINASDIIMLSVHSSQIIEAIGMKICETFIDLIDVEVSNCNVNV